ncbi:MAG: hypothetical protein LQ351_003834 [Letrouitia transgressa]|nr:MAG: hypothetical protein LQ351_003834 [Letrouitia transgressa]
MYNYSGNNQSFLTDNLGYFFWPLHALPPGMSAPGVAPPPGMQSDSQQQNRSGLPPNFQPPANLPSNINFNAPVIRLGTTGPGKPSTPLGGDAGRRETNAEPRSTRPGLGAGIGMEAQRQAVRESMMQLVPPTKEETLKTIQIGGITEGAGGDNGIERILQSAGRLRRWTRAMDADNKPCRFGFAEYEDPDSLSTAIDVLKDLEVPVKQQPANGVSDGENAEDVRLEKSKLIVIVDDASLTYLDQYRASRADQDPIQAQLRLNAAKSALAGALSDLSNPSSKPAQDIVMSNLDQDGDFVMQNGDEKMDAEVVTIPLTVDDELSDIPAEMRETVAKEIAAFRDRSTRRDMERLRREEEMEAMERQRNMAQSRPSRHVSPPLAAPTGPAGGANGIPVGPRDRGVPNAPAGPKGYHGSQIPRDYEKGVTFVNGTGINGVSGSLLDQEDEDSDASDEELERRRKLKKEAELEKQYQDQKRRWLNRERSRTAALERERDRDRQVQASLEAEKAEMEKRLREWDDDVVAKSGKEEYYNDRSTWLRKRAAFRNREATLDEADRAAEEREKIREAQKREQEMGLADSFLNQQALELDAKAQAPQEPQRFKLSLGAATQKAQAAANAKRIVADVEGLLEDEEEANTTVKRTLIPIKFDSTADAMGLTEEERAQAARQLAADIPSDKDGLWKWPVKWEFVDETVLGEQLRPFVEKKIVEYLGVQEQMLVEAIEDHVRKRGAPQDLVDQLEGASSFLAKLLINANSITTGTRGGG